MTPLGQEFLRNIHARFIDKKRIHQELNLSQESIDEVHGALFSLIGQAKKFFEPVPNAQLELAKENIYEIPLFRGELREQEDDFLSFSDDKYDWNKVQSELTQIIRSTETDTEEMIRVEERRKKDKKKKEKERKETSDEDEDDEEDKEKSTTEESLTKSSEPIVFKKRAFIHPVSGLVHPVPFEWEEDLEMEKRRATIELDKKSKLDREIVLENVSPTKYEQ